jgi:hypothetical protein
MKKVQHFGHWESSNQAYTEISPHHSQNGCHQGSKQPKKLVRMWERGLVDMNQCGLCYTCAWQHHNLPV